MKKPLLSLLFLLTIFAARAQSSKVDTNQANTNQKRNTSPQQFIAVEKEAVFPGGVNNFYNYIGHNLRYPENAIKNKIEGKVSVSFVVDKNGKLVEIKIIKGVSPDIDAEAVRLFRNSPRWMPGIQNGILVKQQYAMNIIFQLPTVALAANAEQTDTTWKKRLRDTSRDNKIFSAVQREPMFKGGIRFLDSYLHQTINYPEKAKKSHIQGIAAVTFVIEKDGSLSDIRVAKSSGSDDLDAEAVRVMKICPNWYPGIQNDRYVRVQYTVPIRFSLGNN